MTRLAHAILVLLLALPPAGAVEVGEPAPGFELPRLDTPGRLALADLSGQWVYVDFWASWCAPCRDSFAWMNGLVADSTENDMRVVAVGVDRERADAEAFLRRYEAAFPVLWDGQWHTPKAWDIETMPSSYLVDPDGIVRHVHHGFRKGDQKTLRQRLTAIIAKEGG